MSQGFVLIRLLVDFCFHHGFASFSYTYELFMAYSFSTPSVFKCSYNLHGHTSFLGIPDAILIQVPPTTTLQCLANHIGNSSMQLGVELGLAMSEIQNIQYEHKDKLLNQTKEILRIWQQKKAPKSTNLSLIKALHRIGKINCISMIR